MSTVVNTVRDASAAGDEILRMEALREIGRAHV